MSHLNLLAMIRIAAFVLALMLSAPVFSQSLQQTTGVQVHPNPVDNELVVQLTDSVDSEVKLVDFTGREVFSRPGRSRHRIDISGMQEGRYFVLVAHSQGKTEVHRVIVRR